jgi:hypothetical protein
MRVEPVDLTVPTSWLQDKIVEHLCEVVVGSVAHAAGDNEVKVLVGKVQEDGRLLISWTWKPQGTTRIADVRSGKAMFTMDEAIASYVSSGKRSAKRKK